MSKILNRYITTLDYIDQTFLVSPNTSKGVFICVFTTVIHTPIEIASTSVSLVFFICKRFVKMFLKAIRKKKIYAERMLYWPEVSYII